jgi:hypothetical protein
VPGVDEEVPVGGGLAADRVETGAVQQRRQQRVGGARLVQARQRGRGARERGEERRVGGAAGGGGRGAEEAVERAGHRRVQPFQRLAR